MKLTRGVLSLLCSSVFISMTFGLAPAARAQQTLGSIEGEVVDSSGAAAPKTAVEAVGDQTKLDRTTVADGTGVYNFVNLPLGTYTLTFKLAGFQTLSIPSILVQANRTVTVNATLQVGEVGTTVTVSVTPLINSVDTTNGYVLDTSQLTAIPSQTGSFTQVAVLTPGVNAELSGGSGANAGLGNAPIWANGQRDTSNSFNLNGVDGSNLFNGKSTSMVGSARVVNNTGVSQTTNISAMPIQSTASIYLAIGEALPTPPPETLDEVRVNASMYDAQEGSNSGAHIDMSTSSGTNDIHGSAYFHGENNWLNAAPFFFNADPNLSAAQKVPGLNRYVEGGTLGGPIVKNKVFAFISYQNLKDADQEIGLSRTTVPIGLTNDRSPAALAAIANDEFDNGVSSTVCQTTACEANTLNTGNINPIAYALLNYKLPNGQYLVPSANGNTPSTEFPENALVPGTAYFMARQAVGDLDWDPSPTHTVALKYYYQDDPSVSPYAYSSFAGFTQHLHAGSQTFSVNNTQLIKPNLSVTEIFGFVREKTYSNASQPFTTQSLATYVQQLVPGTTTAAATINDFGAAYFPGLSVVDTLGDESDLAYLQSMNFGATASSQGDLTGVAQNRFMPSANAIWILGKHTITFGGSFSYTQLNTIDNRTNIGMIAFPTFASFLQGVVTPIPGDSFNATTLLVGNASRYYRANQSGEYIEDKFQVRSNLSVTLGLRWDWDGGLTEKYGHIYNFNPADYSFNVGTDAFNTNSAGNPETGLVVAGNNKQFPTPGTSNTTLTGRQWGFAPRIGAAWSPKKFDNKLVLRIGSGMYYDRGELFAYLSPGYTAGITTGGPFGVNQTPPAVATQSCPQIPESFPPICDPGAGYSFASPWGPTKEATPSGNPATIVNFLPNMDEIANDFAQPYSLTDYNSTNKLPYSIASTFDVQWQPRSDLAIDIGYVNALGRHEVVPIPFNQPGIATPTNPIHGQDYTYGYTVVSGAPGCADTFTCSPINLPNGQGPMLGTFEGGNTDLRVPYIGYAGESLSYTAAGISVYNALQVHIEKRMSHGLQAGVSYTLSRSMDDQSALGLFYNGNNPQNLGSAYGLSDFDRTHVLNFDFRYELHSYFPEASLRGVLADGWALDGIITIQSGQPYSVIDYTGAVGSIFYGTANGITNPIVPLANNCTAAGAVTGASGANPNAPALNAACFTVQTLAPGALNGAIPAGDTFETNFVSTGLRNVFRQSWQRNADISVVKDTKINERLGLRFSLDVYNITNTPSFDIPIDNVTQNEFYDSEPLLGQPAVPNTCSGAGPTNGSFYNCPGGLGLVTKTIGSPREFQLSLALQF